MKKEKILEPKTTVQLKINQPIEEVFNAIVDPVKICEYFTSTASGPLVEGSSVTWSWADVGAEFSIRVQKVEANKRVLFQWPATGVDSLVDITLEPLSAESTLIKVLETGWTADQKGVDRSNRQTAGWMHMFCCMKAFLEYGVNLRRGGVFK